MIRDLHVAMEGAFQPVMHTDSNDVRRRCHWRATPTTCRASRNTPNSRLLPRRAGRSYFRILTARAPTTTIVASDVNDWIAIIAFARPVKGNASVGLNAVEFVNDTYR